MRWLTVVVVLSQMQAILSTLISKERNILPLFANREEIADFLETEGYSTAIELGVQRGEFAAFNLARWSSCQKYHLIDVWQSLENATDMASSDQEQEECYQDTLRRLQPWQEKTAVHRMLTTEAAASFADSTIDFIYMDAHHDFCGTKEDMQLYWPKLRPGGIMAGHGFLSQQQVSSMTKADWSLCASGQRHPGAVKAAVEDFAGARKLRIYVTYFREEWPTWLIRKPARKIIDSKSPLIEQAGNATELSDQDMAA